MPKQEAGSAITDAEEEGSPTPDGSSEKAEQVPPKGPSRPRVPSPVDFFALAPDAPDEDLKTAVERHISRVIDQADSIADYNVVILYDEIIITRSDANRIYRALASVDQNRPILLVLKSPGGDIPAALLHRQALPGTHDRPIRSCYSSRSQVRGHTNLLWCRCNPYGQPQRTRAHRPAIQRHAGVGSQTLTGASRGNRITPPWFRGDDQ